MKKGIESVTSLQETVFADGISLSRPHKKASNPTFGFGQQRHVHAEASRQDLSF